MIQEQWRDIDGYENLYQVSSFGHVKSVRNSLILKPSKDGRGYLFVCLAYSGTKHNVRVHCIVANAFLGDRPNGWHINHKNGIKIDNTLTNLEYCTPSQNNQHKYDNGLQARQFGSKNCHSKLNESQVSEIKKSLRSGEPQNLLANRYHVSNSTICDINKGKRWVAVQ